MDSVTCVSENFSKEFQRILEFRSRNNFIRVKILDTASKFRSSKLKLLKSFTTRLRFPYDQAWEESSWQPPGIADS